MIEEWRDVPEWPNYRVSSFGQIERGGYTDSLGRSWKPKLLKVFKKRYVSLQRNGEYHEIVLARLVLLAFVGPAPTNKPFALHRDDDSKNNNALSNLYWGDKSDNANDAFRNGKSQITEQQKIKISESLKGHTVSKSTRAKLAASVKAAWERGDYNQRNKPGEAVAALPEGYEL